MNDIELHDNFLLLKEWNGEEDLEDILRENNNGVGIKRCLDELNKDIYLRMHPLLVLFAKKGFRHVEVIRYGFNTSVNKVSKIMFKLLNCLSFFGIVSNNFETSDKNYDSDWLKSAIDSKNTYGDAISVLISSECETTNKDSIIYKSENPSQATTIQLFIFLFFINTYWYREMRYHLTHGSNADKYRFFAYFFRECINLDLMGSDNDDDLDIRARIIFQKYNDFTSMSNRCKEIILLDGHGRMFRRILNLIINGMSILDTDYPLLTIDELIINVYDLNFCNHLWHSYFFPHTEYHQSAIHDDVLTNKVFNSITNNNGILYLNFSDINIQEEKLKNFIELFKTIEEKKRLVVSFHVNKYLHSLVPFIEENIGMIRPHSYRHDYVTYYIV